MEKNIKDWISCFLVISMLIFSSITVFALSDTTIPNSNNVIDNNLLSIIHESTGEFSEHDLIPVWIWYQDINHNEVNQCVERLTGLTSENCSVVELSESGVEITPENIKDNIETLVENTKQQRLEENARVDRYINTHRAVSRELYSEKANQILNKLDLQPDCIHFVSQYTPVIIAKLTKDEIIKIASYDEIKQISYDSQPATEAPSIGSAKVSSGQTLLNDNIGLTGDGVKVGMVDRGFPQSDDDLDVSHIVNVGNVNSSGHAKNTAKVLVGNGIGFCPNIELYSTNDSFANIEALLSYGVKILNVSYGWKYSESTTSEQYAYSIYDKWFDHIVYYHNVTVVASAGNDGNGTSSEHGTLLFKRVLSPAMGRNVIAVGAYDDKDTESVADDTVCSYSSYKDSNGSDLTTGVAKPDTVMPSNFLGGGTSTSAPVLTALLAQILELKPALANYPEIVKAIVLASCNRKALPSSAGETQEFMTDGITERQGAGIADGWHMAAIVCQGTYGNGIINNYSADINFMQPKYKSSCANFSLTWLTTCIPIDSPHTSFSNILADELADLDLCINQQSTISNSALSKSTTEMCYFDLSGSDWNYTGSIDPYYGVLNSKYGYAWSTNLMNAPRISDRNAGVFRIRIGNSSNNFLQYNDSAIFDYLNISGNIVSDLSDLFDSHSWIIEKAGNGYYISTGYGSTKYYLNQSNHNLGSDYYACASATPVLLSILENPDGTCSIINTSENTILMVSQNGIFWESFSANQTIEYRNKFRFDRVNYLKGDVDMDGVLSTTDATETQLIYYNMMTPTNIQKYLSDVDSSGIVDSDDWFIIMNCIANDYYYPL
ncbi:MAG: S8 family serine peptidase [Ruminococcus sp.]|nr:S8 family serine peptidase [Ruminococcus sp.]